MAMEIPKLGPIVPGRQWPDGDLQDGMLKHYLAQTKLTDWYAARENETQPFDWRDLSHAGASSRVPGPSRNRERGPKSGSR